MITIQNKEMKVAYLVTGGTGFVGSYIVHLLTEGGEQVVAYDSAPDINLLEQIMGKEKINHVTIVLGDITNPEHLIRICQEYNIDRIIHTAAVIGSENPPLTVRVNCDGTINVLEASRILGIKRVVLTSSIAVFGPADKYKDGDVLKDAPHYPQTIYGACKSLNEVFAGHYFRQYGLDTIVIRLLQVYGFGRSKARRLTSHEELFVKPALGMTGRVPLYGDSTSNWVYVEDAARALVMASKVKKTKTRVFTADGDIRSADEIADYVRSLIPGADITLLPGSAGSDGYPYKFDTASIREEIGYRPEWTMERGIKKFIDSVRKQSQTTGG
ncbi:NAD-dependent epimerase/dehydratase family protein [Thermodesulfobacteriota bacterium]